MANQKSDMDKGMGQQDKNIQGGQQKGGQNVPQAGQGNLGDRTNVGQGGNVGGQGNTQRQGGNVQGGNLGDKTNVGNKDRNR